MRISICTPPPPPGREVYRETVRQLSSENLEVHPSPPPVVRFRDPDLSFPKKVVSFGGERMLSSPPIFWLGGTAYAMSPPINTLVPPNHQTGSAPLPPIFCMGGTGYQMSPPINTLVPPNQKTGSPPLLKHIATYNVSPNATTIAYRFLNLRY